MLKFDDVTLRRGPRILFSNASFSLFRGEKVGITGENGSGKSSLLALVRGELQPDAGHFTMPGNLAMAHVAQELDAIERPAIEFVLDGDTELRGLEAQIARAEAEDHGTKLAELYTHYAAIGGYDARARAAQLLHGLGFAPGDEERRVAEFSGGWRVRLNVARALMCRSDLLLLDEPTNHLDLDAIVWLEGWLQSYQGTLLLIAHDREFLDRVVNRIVNLEHQQAALYTGNYSAFESARAAQLAQQGALYARQQREIAHMEDFVRRFRAKASKARQAQSRIKALERMQRIAPAHVDSPFEFSFAEPPRLPRPLLAIEQQSAGYGGRVLLEKVNLTVYPGDRISLLGRNGAGKSTLVKLLANELPARGGARDDARDLSIGYFAQHQLEQLDPQASPLLHLQRLAQKLGQRPAEQEQRNYLAGYGFTGDRVFAPVGPFSGGEKARLALALVAYGKPNLLLLDEPTNHLDLEMRQALAMALQEYAGAVVMVSHDRHLLNTVSDRFLLVDGGRVRDFDGDLDDYARWLARSDAARRNGPEQSAVASVATSTPPQDKAARGTSRANAQQRRQEEAAARKELAPLRARLARCEQRLQELAAQARELDVQLADPALYAAGGHERQLDLNAARARIALEIEQVEAEWLEVTEQLERAADA
ncbi:MAG TPA: ATP-binding cassette domain-containing protein [Steroidobacteraceae bacterium]|nr:ATP-binding cassette domain-containing protein [Steroidobacteraceae bacterium]